MKRKSVTCPYCGVKGKYKIEILKIGDLKRRIKICSACGWGIKEELI